MSIIKVIASKYSSSTMEALHVARVFSISLADETQCFTTNYVVRLLRYNKLRKNLVVISSLEFDLKGGIFSTTERVIMCDNDVLGKFKFHDVRNTLQNCDFSINLKNL